MKNALIKLTVVIIASIFTSPAYCQIQKDKWIAGIGFSYGTSNFISTQTNRDQKTTSGDVSLSIGRILTKKIVVGVGYSYSTDKSSSIYSEDNYYKSNANSNGASLILSHFSHLEKQFYYSPGFILSYSKSISKFLSKQPGFVEIVNKNSSTIFSSAIFPIQFSYLLKNKFLMQAGFGEIRYAYTSTTSDIPTNIDAVGKSHGFNISFFPNVSNISFSIIF